MEEFKIDLYQKENNKDFPTFKKLSEFECKDIRDKICKMLSIRSDVDKLDIVLKLSKEQILFADFNAKDPTFSILECMLKLNLNFDNNIYLNWFRFDDIDIFNVNDLNHNFDSIWFAGADDIDLFDENLEWILSVRHDGNVYSYKAIV